ncbi:MAG: MraY family glycosyltransferase, partial [Planctomycetota bacterium]
MLVIGFYLFFLALLVSLLFTPLSSWLSFRFNVLDRPIGNKRHLRPMPLLGGVGMFATCVVVIGAHLLALPLLHQIPALEAFFKSTALNVIHIAPEGLKQLGIIAAGGALIFLVGLLDDSTYFDIRWRLLSEFLVAGLVTYLGIRPELDGVPALLSWPITIVWIVGVTNAFNLLDGMDGMVAGITVIAAGLMAIFCFMTQQIMIAFLLLILCGAVAGFLKSNWNPASIYMGSCGSLFLGYMMATVPLVVAFMQEQSTLAAVAIPLLVLSVPIYDTISVISIRIRNKRSPFAPDHNHIFHRLSRLGLSVKKVVSIIYLLGFAVGLSAMLLFEAREWEVALICIHILAMYGVFIIIETV